MSMQPTRRERWRSHRKGNAFILIAMFGVSIRAHAASGVTGPSILPFSGFSTLGVVGETG
jgi:hypothetical protein